MMSRTRPRCSISAIALVGAALLLSPVSGRGAPADEATALLARAGLSGGLVVHLGCGDGRLTAALRTGDALRVHGLDRDADAVASARAFVREQGFYGPVAAMALEGRRLPYTDNFVNLLLVSDDLGIPAAEMDRVLVPGGKRLVRNGQGWTLETKPRDGSQSDWTHYLNQPDNNAVTSDREVGEPRALQWVAPPRWGRSHEELASVSAMVSTGGRLFYIVDEAPLASIRFTSDWKLVARDAHNGTLLWKQPIPNWVDHLRHFRSGPAHLPRRLVARGSTVYVTLGLAAPVTALDTATGRVLRTYAGTEHTEEILTDGTTLYLVVGSSERVRRGGGLFSRNEPDPTTFRRVLAVDVASGATRWQRDVTAENILPLTLALQGDRLYLQTTSAVVSLATADGADVWRTPRATPGRRMGFSAPTLVATRAVVLCADRDPGDKEGVRPAKDGTIEWGVHGWNEGGFARKGSSTVRAYDAATGRELWSAKAKEGYNSPVDLFVVGDTVWVGPDYRGYDLRSGENRGKVDTKAPRVGMPHHRCYRNKASDQFIFTGKSGIEVLGYDEGWLSNNSWVRGTCQYGILPANGLLYAPPDACGCFLTVKEPGIIALSTQHGTTPAMPPPVRPQLVAGPAAGTVGATGTDHAPADSWPTYRHDAARSGVTAGALPQFPRRAWSVPLGTRVTQPAIAGGRVVVALPEHHSVVALSAEDGSELWRFTANSTVDSTPTLYRGGVYVGSADGWVYALRARDGKVAWRFRAAPEPRWISAMGSLQSVWPVHGSVLIQNDTVYALAGRSSYMDGGLVLYRLNPRTGKQLSRTSLYHLDPETGEQQTKEARFNMEGTTSDLLSGDGDRVFLKYFTFDRDGTRVPTRKPRLFAITGFLGEDWFVRSYWVVGTEVAAGWGGWANAANWYPSGRLLALADDRVFGYGRVKVAGGPTGHRADVYHLFGMPLQAPEGQGGRRPAKPAAIWSERQPVIVRAMVAGADCIAVAGPPDKREKSADLLAYTDSGEALSAFTGDEGVLLRVVRASDGKRISETPLPAMPAFDGMAAAGGRLYVALRDGRVQCFEAGEGTPLSTPPPPPPEPAAPPRRAGSARRPPPAKLEGPDKRADFAAVVGVGIVESDLGYRLSAEKGKPARAVRELPTPIRKAGTFRLRFRRAPEYRHPAVYENAYFAFGSGTDDAALVKCGIKFVMSGAVLITGPTPGPHATSEKVTGDMGRVFDVAVTVDLRARTVSMTVAGKTLKGRLPAGISEITHVGYATQNATSDFSPVRVTGE